MNEFYEEVRFGQINYWLSAIEYDERELSKSLNTRWESNQQPQNEQSINNTYTIQII